VVSILDLRTYLVADFRRYHDQLDVQKGPVLDTS